MKGHGLKPGHVYEISEILDTLVVKDVGESHIPESFSDLPEGISGSGCWKNDIGYLVDAVGKTLILTKDEYERCCRDE